MRGKFLAPWGRFTVPDRDSFVLFYIQSGPLWVELVIPQPEEIATFDRRGYSHTKLPWPGLHLGRVEPYRVSANPYRYSYPTYRLDLGAWFEQGDGINLVLNYYAGESGRFSGCAWIQRSSKVNVAYAGVSESPTRLYLGADGIPAEGLASCEFFDTPGPVAPLPDPPLLVWMSQRSYRPGQVVWGYVWSRKRASRRGWDLIPGGSLSSFVLQSPEKNHTIRLQARPLAAGCWELRGEIPPQQALGEYGTWNSSGRWVCGLHLVQSEPGALQLTLDAEPTPGGLLLHFQLPSVALEQAAQQIYYTARLVSSQDLRPPTFLGFAFHDPVSDEPQLDQRGQISLSEARQRDLLLRWKRPPQGKTLEVHTSWGGSKNVYRWEFPRTSPRLGLRWVRSAAPGQEGLVEVVVTDPYGNPLGGFEVRVYFPGHQQQAWTVESADRPVTASVTVPPDADLRSLAAELIDSGGEPIRASLWWSPDPPIPTASLSFPLVAELDRSRYEVGDTAVLTVRCPVPKAHGALRIWNGGLLEHRWLNWEGQEITVPLVLSAEHAPLFQVEVSLFGLTNQGVRGHWRVVEARVEHPQRHLQVELRLAHKALAPRAEQQAWIEVRDARGRPVQGARIAMCAADARVASDLPSPLEHFYKPQPYRGVVHTSWHNTPLQHPSKMDEIYAQDKNLLFSDQPSRDMAGSPAPARVDFAATAFATGDLVSDEDGRALVNFPAGERLAPFLVTAVVCSSDDAWGTAQASYAVTQGVTLQPGIPPFLRAGDRLLLPVLLENPGQDAQSVRLGLRSRGPLTCRQAAFECHLPAQSGAEVLFELNAGGAGWSRVGLLAQGATETDHLEFPLEILGVQAWDAFGSLEWEDAFPPAGWPHHPGHLIQRRREFDPPTPVPKALKPMHSPPANSQLTATVYNFKIVLNNCLELAERLRAPLEAWPDRLLELIEYLASGCPDGGEIAYPVHRAEVLWTAFHCAECNQAFLPCWQRAQQLLDEQPLAPELVAWEVLMDRPGASDRFLSSLVILATTVDSPSRENIYGPQSARWLFPPALLALILKLDPEHPLVPLLLWSAWETQSYPGYAVGNWIWELALSIIKPGFLLEQTLLLPALPCDHPIDQGIPLELQLTGLERDGNLVRGALGQRVTLTILVGKCLVTGATRLTLPLPAALEIDPPPPRSQLAIMLFDENITRYADRIECEKKNLLSLRFSQTLHFEGVLTRSGSFSWPGVRIYQLHRLSCWGATPDLRLEVH